MATKWLSNGQRYGEIVDVNLVRDKATGKSKGFAFIAYEDQRSTILAVDNLNGAKVLGRIIRVDHVSKYKKKEEEEDDETARQKREARGVCRAFQRGECTRGASCKFSHDEHRNANTGWGPQDTDSRWKNDRYDGPPKSHKNSSSMALLAKTKEDEFNNRSLDIDGRFSRLETDDDYRSSQRKHNEWRSKGEVGHRGEKTSERRRYDSKQEDGRDDGTRDKDSYERYRSERDDRDERDRRDEKISERRMSESKQEDEKDIRTRDGDSKRCRSKHDGRDERDRRVEEKRSRHDAQSSEDYHRSRR